MNLVVDLRSRQVIASTTIAAPKEGGSERRVSWLLRQLEGAPENLTVEVRVSRSRTSLATTLAEAQASPETLYPEQGKEIRQFVLSLSRNLGLKRDAGGRGSFIGSVMTTGETFYSDVLRKLRAWKPTPPRLKERPEEEPAPVERVLDAVPEAEATIESDELERESAHPSSGDRSG